MEARRPRRRLRPRAGGAVLGLRRRLALPLRARRAGARDEPLAGGGLRQRACRHPISIKPHASQGR